jgi:hypothetical protein
MPLPAQFAATHVLMIEPVRFRYNEETGGSNAFQSVPSATEAQAIAALAVEQHRNFRDLLVSNGVHVTVVRCDERTPDAPFCNNWFSTHTAAQLRRDGVTQHMPASMVLYPLLAPNRRLERRSDLIAMLRTKYPRLVDLSGYEREARFLESTGSLCLDDKHRVAYAALSPRTDANLVRQFGAELGYEVELFTAVDATGVPYYHTNVMMFIGHGVAGVTLESIVDPMERDHLERRMAADGLDVLPITQAQAAQFCGNVLSLSNDAGEPLFVMSSAAYRAYNDAERNRLGAHGRILHSELSAFERVGGGSARCLIAELF